MQLPARSYSNLYTFPFGSFISVTLEFLSYVYSVWGGNSQNIVHIIIGAFNHDVFAVIIKQYVVVYKTLFVNLSVHGHWNNSEEKKYSRNLEKSKGIELIYLKKYQRFGVTEPPIQTIKIFYFP